MMPFVGATMLVVAAVVVAISHCPLARAIGLSMRSFADASRGEPDVLR